MTTTKRGEEIDAYITVKRRNGTGRETKYIHYSFFHIWLRVRRLIFIVCNYAVGLKVFFARFFAIRPQYNTSL